MEVGPEEFGDEVAKNGQPELQVTYVGAAYMSSSGEMKMSLKLMTLKISALCHVYYMSALVLHSHDADA